MAIPLLVAGGIAAAGAIGSAGAAAAGVGKNKRKAGAFYDPTGERNTGYDPNATRWGGREGGLQAYQDQNDARRLGVESRGPNLADYHTANMHAGNALQSRGGQERSAALMMNRATGATPSIAGQQAAVDMNRARAAQSSMAASARGPAALAAAQRTAANNLANTQGQISNNAQINAAQERLAAENAAFGAYTGIRGGDVTSQGQEIAAAQFQAQQEQRNRDANDARAMGYEQFNYGAGTAELGAKTQGQGILAGSYGSAEKLNQDTAQANANNNRSWWEKIIPSDEQMKNVMSMTSMLGGKKEEDEGGGGDVYAQAGKSSGGGTDYGGLASMAMGGGGAGAAGAKGAAAAMGSDTRTKQSALLAKGRAQGAAMARGVSPDDVNYIKYGSWSGNADPTALDERYKQNEVGPETVGKEALDQAIFESQVREARSSPQRTQDSALLARGGQPTEGQRFDRDEAERPWLHRRAEAANTTPEKEQTPWWMTPVDSNFFRSDERAKREAFQEGVLHGQVVQAVGDPEKAPPVPDYMKRPAPVQQREMQGKDPKPGKGPRQPAEESRRALVIQSGPDREGLPSKAITTEAMMNRPSEVTARPQAPSLYDARFARPTTASPPPPPPSTLDRALKGAALGWNTEPIPRQPTSDERAKNVDGGVLAGANRAMRGKPYTYREEYTPPHEEQGQPHYGFMAQDLEKNPVTATAVDEGPDGMKVVDRDRMLQVVASGVSDLQRQQDETRKVLLKKGGRR